MQRSITITRTVVLVAGIVQLILGLLFWGDIAKSLVPLHETIGSILVLALWTLAILCARLGAPVGLVILTVVWGLVVPVLGVTQEGLLRGSLHPIIQVIHLLLGIGAMGLASILAARVLPRQPGYAHDPANS
jgi:hypothetical protein